MVKMKPKKPSSEKKQNREIATEWLANEQPSSFKRSLKVLTASADEYVILRQGNESECTHISGERRRFSTKEHKTEENSPNHMMKCH